MGKALKAANQKIEKNIGFDIKNPEALHEDPDFDKYEKLMDSGEAFDVDFTACSPDGTFTATTDGLYIVMSGSTTIKHMPYFQPRLRTVLLGYKFNVRVASVDRAEKRVYVESTRKAASEKATIVHEILSELENKNYPVVWGKVTSVHDDVAYVDILGMNISGRVDIMHWQKTYLRHLTSACMVNEFYQFQITGYWHHRGKERIFLLEHRNLGPNPWNLIPKDIFVEDAVVKIRCIELPEKRTYWWGVSPLATGIEIMGNYPSTERFLNLRIIPGITYNCKVKEVKIYDEGAATEGEENTSRKNRPKNMLKVTPLAVVEEDKKRYENYLQATSAETTVEIPNLSDSEKSAEMTK